MAKFLDTAGVTLLWSKIKDIVGTKVDKVDGKGLSTNDYTTAEKQKLAGVEASANNYSLPAATSNTLGGIKVGENLTVAEGVLSATVPTNNNQLINGAGYQTADDVSDAIEDALGDLEGARFEVVDNLPIIGETGKIYLIPDANDGENNSYDEYIWIENIQAYEKIGNTDIDLSDYYNTSNLVALTTAEIDEICV